VTQPAAEQLLNLADRAEKGLTADEAARLRDGLIHHCARAEKAEAEVERMKLLVAASSEEGHAVRMAAQYAERAIENGERAERAEAAIERVRVECDRIEAAVHDSPTSPDLAGGYLACLRHIRAALDPQEPQP
jgi:hypothetical protein